MNKSINSEELLRLAISDESSGIQLYKNLEEEATAPDLKRAFARLSDQEKVHKERFQKLHDSLPPGQDSPHYPDYYADYLEAMMADGGQTIASDTTLSGRTDRELINLAIEFEKEQLLIQKDIAEFLNLDDNDAVAEIIEEEREHIRTLGKLRKLTT